MKRFFLFVSLLLVIRSVFCQKKEDTGAQILFHGIVMDASTLAPLPNTQIYINNSFNSVSYTDGNFSFYIYKNDTVYFKHLGYKSTFWFINDTLKGNDFVAGIYLPTDTLAIGEVIIIPRISNLKSDIMNAPSKVPATMENAKYNIANAGYQGRTTQGKLGDAASNYSLIRQQQKTNAYEKGGIPSDMIAGFSPLMIIPAAYFLLHGLPERPAPFDKKLTKQELDQIYQKYLESVQNNK